MWIDIKFAPRDGTLVDLWGKAPNVWPHERQPAMRWTDCRWEPDRGEWVQDTSEYVIAATHWTPIPPTPRSIKEVV